MAQLTKILESKTSVQYHDCDPFNHLNNSRYIDYIMGARTEQLLEQYGFDAAEMAHKHGLGWVTAQTQISYFYPAFWMEKVTIESRLIFFSESKLIVEAFMWDEQKKHLKAVLWATLVHFNISAQKSQKHSEELMKLFQEVHFPLEELCTFEERVKTLRS